MDAFCLIVAGVVHAALPAQPFTLAWTHSVQKLRWSESYRPLDDALLLVEARASGSAAGLEPPDDARYEGGEWVWSPQRRIDEITLSRSRFAGDYTLCSGADCRSLETLLAQAPADEPVRVKPCDATLSRR